LRSPRSWKEPGGGLLRSCTMIITAANDFMAPIHNRMPVEDHQQL
jgi:putative SOS response-associated peptidase YedK